MSVENSETFKMKTVSLFIAGGHVIAHGKKLK